MKLHRITVKDYMLNKGNPNFTFMEVWNNNEPMPFNCMDGAFEKETTGMVYGTFKKDNYRWTGWVIKSAILNDEIIGEVNPNVVITVNQGKGDLSDDSLFISFPYDAEVVDIIRNNFTCKRYHTDTKSWEILLRDLTKFKAIFDKYNIIYHLNENPLKNALKSANTTELEYKTIPYKHQKEAVEYGMCHNKWLLSDEPGLGKTKIGIDIAINRKKQELKHCLIISGVNGLKWNWKNEIETHSNEKGYVLGERIGERATNLDKLHELENLDDLDSFFIITNIETLRFARKTGKKIRRGNKVTEEKIYMITDKLIDLIIRGEIGMIICDEIHRMKDPESIQGHQFLRLQAPIELAMTGTPLMNSPLDLYIIFKWLGYETHNFYSFKNHYCLLGGYNGYTVIGNKNMDEMHERFNNLGLRRLKSEVLDLPEKIHINEYVEMGKDQKAIYNEVRSKLLSDMSENIDKFKLSPDPLSQLIRLRQATATTSILSSKINESIKFERTLELIEDAISNNRKVVIFSNWLQVINPLYEILSRKYSNVGIISGEVKELDRMKYIDKFQNDPECKIMLGTIGAMGTGITLTAGTVEIFLDEPWNAAIKNQAEDRCHRVGSKENITIYTLLCKGTIDEKINNIVKYKQGLSDKIVDGIDNSINLLNYLINY